MKDTGAKTRKSEFAFKPFIINVWQKYKDVFLWALGGAINTVVTYGLYLLLNLILNYTIAFTGSYVIGIIFAYFYNSLVVFKSPLSYKKFATFPLVYLVQYLLSLVLLAGFVQILKLSEIWAPILVLIIVTPVTYLLSKWILQGKNDRSN
jgi:putative flippase GtrA